MLWVMCSFMQPAVFTTDVIMYNGPKCIYHDHDLANICEQ